MNVATRVVLLSLLVVLTIGPVGSLQAQARESKTVDIAKRGRHMTTPRARFYISRHLKDAYGKRWDFGNHKSIYDCKNLRPWRVTCSVYWEYNGNWAFKGHAAAYYRSNGDIWTRINIKGNRI